LEKIQADVLARYYRLKGLDVFFLTGTDEHGAKIAKAAKEAGMEPSKFVDDISWYFRNLVKEFNISNDDFIRTTDQKRHWPTVFKLWKILEKNGDLYKARYKGLYCYGHEAFVKKSELKDGSCPDHKIKPQKIEEENYFFRLTKYKEEVKKMILFDRIKILPEYRKEEVLNMIKDSEDVFPFPMIQNIQSMFGPMPFPIIYQQLVMPMKKFDSKNFGRQIFI